MRPPSTKKSKSFFDYSTREKKRILYKAAIEGAKAQQELVEKVMSSTEKWEGGENMAEGLLESREKYWSELTDTEKIERLREYAQRVESLTERINELDAIVREHRHGGDGILLPVERAQLLERGMRRRICYGCDECQKRARI